MDQLLTDKSSKSNALRNRPRMLLSFVCCLAVCACNTLPGEMPADVAGTPAVESKAEDSADSSLSLEFRVAPESGPVEGGTVVTIVGKNFAPQTSVEFGANASPQVNVLNDQVLTAVTPPGDPGTVNIVLRGLSAAEGIGSPRLAVIQSGFVYYILPPDDGTDTDSDGLTDYAELAGWEVWVDAFGLGLGSDTFGNVVRYTCISDPNSVDTDGDGLTDHEEFKAKCDARKQDTDGDGLFDYEEVTRWHTSPISIDTDGDSRGDPESKQAPNVALFDGAELKTVGFEPSPVDLFISEYVEGANSNRAIEIYNPTPAAIDLAAAQIRLAIYRPDNTGVDTRISLSGTIPARGAYVVAHSAADASLRDRANRLSALPFDGTQAVALERGSATIDSMGTTVIRMGQFQTDAVQSAYNGSIDGATERWQEFVPASTGILTTLHQRVNTNFLGGNVRVRLLRGATVIGDTTVFAPPSQFGLWTGPQLNVYVQAGEMLRFYISSTGDVSHTYASGNPYPAGHSSIANADLTFVTYVAPLLPQADGTRSMRDQTLRREPAAHAVDSNLADPVSLSRFTTFAAADLSGLGAHRMLPAARIIAGGTSPSLADTDGDNMSDYDEFASATRNPLIAELPGVAVELVGPVDMRLHVEYAEEQGSAREYGTQITQGTNKTLSTSSSRSVEATLGITTNMTTAVVVPWAGKAEFEVGYNASITSGGTWESSESTETSNERTSVDMQTDSQSLTETVSTGSIRTGLRITNSGPVSFSLNNLGVTLQCWEPRVDPAQPTMTGDVRTLGTLAPKLASVTLAPGESTPVLELAAEDVDASIVRKFLSKPTNIRYQPAYFDLLDADGRNFAFLREVTFARTAVIEIDFGDGASERYQIATNVDRSADGGFAGVRLVDALAALGVPCRVEDLRNSSQQIIGTGITQVRGVPAGAPSRFGFWVLGGNADGLAGGRVEDVTLRAGKGVSLAYIRDDDQDGIWGFEEQVAGTRDDPSGGASTDTDQDGLSDAFESHNTTDGDGAIIQAGWDVVVQDASGASRTYRVTSSPRNRDTDYDGRSDYEEFVNRTDPNLRDTDGDGIIDSVDPQPTQAAIRLYVRPGGTGPDGTTWARAYGSVLDAVNEARSRFVDSRSDVSEIWVARGRYETANTHIYVDFPIALYGGFVGGEKKLAERTADAFNNQTELARVGTGGHIMINRYSGVLLDGFTLAGNVERALFLDSFGSVATISNCLFLGNTSRNTGGAAIHALDCNVSLVGCVFAGNIASEQAGSAGIFGGAVNLTRVSATIRDCVFENNAVQMSVAGGNAGALRLTNSTALVTGCRFRGNTAHLLNYLGPQEEAHGGAVVVYNENDITMNARFENCQFLDNEVRVNNPIVDRYNQRYAGGAFAAFRGATTLVNCVFARNVAPGFAGAVWRHNFSSLPLYVVNCTLTRNAAWSTDSGARYCTGGGIGTTGTTVIVNSLLYGNFLSRDRAGILDPADTERLAQVSELLNYNGSYYGFGYATADNSCIRGIFSWALPGTGSFDADPQFATQSFTLRATSPCIDAGRTYYDTDTYRIGYQALPAADAAGGERVTDGNGDGDAKVDIGAYEFQGSTATSN